MKSNRVIEELPHWLHVCRNDDGCLFVIDTLLAATNEGDRLHIHATIAEKIETILDRGDAYHSMTCLTDEHYLYVFFVGNARSAIRAVEAVIREFNALYVKWHKDSALPVLFGHCTRTDARKARMLYTASHPKFDKRRKPSDAFIAYAMAHEGLYRVMLRQRIWDSAEALLTLHPKVKDWIDSLSILVCRGLSGFVREHYDVEELRDIGRMKPHERLQRIDEVVAQDAHNRITRFDASTFKAAEGMAVVMAMFAYNVNDHVRGHQDGGVFVPDINPHMVKAPTTEEQPRYDAPIFIETSHPRKIFIDVDRPDD